MKKRLLIIILIGFIVVVSFVSLILFNKLNSIKSIEGYTINYYPYEIIAGKNDILVKKILFM